MDSSIVIAVRRNSCAVPRGTLSKYPAWSTGLGSLALNRRLKEIELDLGVRVERESQLRRLVEGALEHLARVGKSRLAVGGVDVAEHAGRALAVAAPRQDLERRGVRLRDHVRLVDARESLDGGAVEADALTERVLEFRGRDGHRLEDAEHVREPQPDESNVALLDAAKHVFLLLIHVPILPYRCVGV